MRTLREVEDEYDARDKQPESWLIDLGVMAAVLVVFGMVAFSWYVSGAILAGRL